MPHQAAGHTRRSTAHHPDRLAHHPDRLAHRTARHKTHRNCCHRHFDKRLRQALARCMDNPRMNDQG